MKSSEVYPSRYLKSEELDQDLTVTIKKVVLEELKNSAGQPEEKPCAYFEETEKGLILNKTNWSQIAKQHGDESDNWVGKEITLTVMDVEAFGDIVSAIRVKTARKPAVAVKGKVSAKAPESESESDPITAFWQRAKATGADRDEALRILKVAKNDFVKALELLPKLD